MPLGWGRSTWNSGRWGIGYEAVVPGGLAAATVVGTITTVLFQSVTGLEAATDINSVFVPDADIVLVGEQMATTLGSAAAVVIQTVPVDGNQMAASIGSTLIWNRIDPSKDNVWEPVVMRG